MKYRNRWCHNFLSSIMSLNIVLSFSVLSVTQLQCVVCYSASVCCLFRECWVKISSSVSVLLARRPTGCHYWECVLKQYGETSRNWKVVIGVVAASVAPSVWKRDKVTIGIARHGMTAPSWGYITAQGKKVSSVSTSSWGTDYTTGASHGRCVEGMVLRFIHALPVDLADNLLSFAPNSGCFCLFACQPGEFLDIFRFH